MQNFSTNQQMLVECAMFKYRARQNVTTHLGTLIVLVKRNVSLHLQVATLLVQQFVLIGFFYLY